MKLFHKLLVPFFVAAVVVGLGLLTNGAVSATEVPTGKPAPPKGPPDVITTSEELTAKWLSQAEGEGWLYFSHKEESPGDNGVDPETGWPISNQTLWERWYKLDSQGKPIIFLLRHTDLERGNVGRVAWQDGVLLRSPSGVREEAQDWQYVPLKDHYCHTWISRTLGFRGELETVGEVVAQWIGTASGARRWQVTMKLSFPPVSVEDASGNAETIVGTILTCTRDGETGAVESSEYYSITPGDGRVLIQRAYDYIVSRVPEPPAEMLALLDQLAQP